MLNFKDPNKKKKSVIERSKAAVKKPKEPKTKDTSEVIDKIIDTSIERKSIRQSTAVKSAETQQRIKIRSELKKKKPKKVEERVLTQEELLAEAHITEKENLKSLERFEQSELERKKVRPTKKSITGPIIKYHSFAVPVPLVSEVLSADKPSLTPITDISLSEIIKSEDGLLTFGGFTDGNIAEPKSEGEQNEKPDVVKMDVDVVGPDEEIPLNDVTKKEEKPKPRENIKYFERTLLSYENDVKNRAFNACFRRKVPRRRRELLCAVTKRPARYIDPITKLPYRSVDAFRIIREAYYQQLEARGDRSDPKLAAWLRWRRADTTSTYAQIHIK